MVLENSHALLVGVSEYKDNTIASVPITLQDAEALKEVLVDPNLAGYPPTQVATLTGTNATRANILTALGNLADASNKKSTILIFLCAHGVPAPDGSYYFLSHEARRAGSNFEVNSVVSSQELIKAIGKIEAKKILIILNTCHSGLMVGSLDPDNQPPSNELLEKILDNGEGRVIISACRSNQKSYFESGARNTLFVQHLIEGLRGQGGIANHKGYIGVFELYNHLYEKVKAGIKNINSLVEQEPVITIREGVGPFPITLYKGGEGGLGASLEDNKKTAKKEMLQTPTTGTINNIGGDKNTIKIKGGKIGKFTQGGKNTEQNIKTGAINASGSSVVIGSEVKGNIKTVTN